jgi:TP901 family phage tail tape measure protein
MADSKYKLALQIVGMVDASLGKSVQLTKKQMRDLAKAAADASNKTVSVSEAFQKASPGIDAMWGGLTKAAGTAMQAMEAAAGLTSVAGLAAIKTGSEFESAMSSWSATASATEAQYEQARQAAMEMGRSTSKTATESANALEYMALAGWSVEDSIQALPDVLRLSEATGLELARTSDLVTDSMSATGETVDDLTKFLNVAAQANNKSNQTAEMLMEAWIGVGGTMKNLNVPIEESATALGILANRGIKGSEAGTALNAVMVNLTTGSGKAGKMMAKLGISAFNNDGSFKGLKQTLLEVNEAVSGMSDEEKNLALSALGGKQHIDALNDLLSGLNTTAADGKIEWDSLADALEHSDGALEKMAAKKMDNLQGDMKIATSAMEDDLIRLYDTFKDPLREAVQTGTQYIYQFGDYLENTVSKAIPTVRRELLDGKDALLEFTDPLIATGKWLIENGDKTAGVIVGIATAITTLKVAKEVNAGLIGIQGFVAAMASNPVTMAIGGLTLLAGAVAGISTAERIAAKKAEKANLAEHFGNMTLSLEELNEAAKDIIGRGTIEDLSNAMEELGKVSDISKKLKDSQKVIERMTWKVKSGMTLDETDNANFEAAIKSQVEESLNLVEQGRFTAKVSVDALFGEGDETGSKIIAGFDELYNGINAEVSALGEQLGKAYNDAMEDGIIDTDEAKIIATLQSQLANITSEVSMAQSQAKLDRIKLEFSGKELDPDTFRNLQQAVNEQSQIQIENARKAYELINMNLSMEKERGNISAKEYESQMRANNEGFQAKLGTITENAFTFSMDTIEESYRSEIEEFTGKIPGILDEALQKMQGGTFGLDAFSGTDLVNSFGVDESTKDAISTLLKEMQPQIDEMRSKAKELEEAGKEIPASLQKGLQDVTMLEALSGDFDAMYEVLGESAADNSEYKSALDTLTAQGAEIPATLGKSIEDNTAKTKRSIEIFRAEVASNLQTEFSKPLDVDARVNINFRPISTSIGLEAAKNTVGIKRNAEGSIVRSPILSWVGEGGDDEGIIPINRSQRAADLYNQVGQELAAAGNTGINSSANVTYAPVINIGGNADAETVQQALKSGYNEFKQYMSRFMRDSVRLGY